MTTPKTTIRLAVLDTDSSFLTVLQRRLESIGWQHRFVAGSVPLDEVVAMKLNVVILDPEALGSDGWDYLERLCGAIPGLGVIVCTGRSTVAQRVRGLRLGADDWISKPCHPEEVLARVEAVVRRRKRAHVTTEVGPLVAGEMEIRSDQFQAYIGGESLGLTRREFELLQVLAEESGSVVERERLYERVWGYAMAHGDRSVDVFVRKLRRKLQARSQAWAYIHTHFGIGYRFEPEAIGEIGDAETQNGGSGEAEAAAPPAESFTSASP
jgi:DNA-binding response OmpR family regulator